MSDIISENLKGELKIMRLIFRVHHAWYMAPTFIDLCLVPLRADSSSTHRLRIPHRHCGRLWTRPLQKEERGFRFVIHIKMNS